jgi:Alkylmercury lyase
MHRMYSPYGRYGDTVQETFVLSDDAKRLRRYFEDQFIRHGSGPGLSDIMTDLGFDQNRTWEALHELERGVQVMFVPGTETLVKMPPFSYVPTRHRVSVDDGRSWYSGCAGESCAINGLFPGETVTVTSTCPDCWDTVVFRAKDRTLVSIEPETAVIHIGIHPRDFSKDWNVTCDNINFFRSHEHVEAWESQFSEKRGVVFPAQLGLQWVDGISRSRYWDYDRGPDVASGDVMVEGFAKFGLDVGIWR